MGKYYYPQGGLPPQTHLTTERAIVTEAYTVIPKGVMTDIVTSTLPGFSNTRSWILARPISGFATTFSQLIVEIGPGGGAPKAEFEAGVEGVVFVTKGKVNLTLDGELHQLEEGGYAYLAAGADLGPGERLGRHRLLPMDPQGLRAARGLRGQVLRHQ